MKDCDIRNFKFKTVTNYECFMKMTMYHPMRPTFISTEESTKHPCYYCWKNCCSKKMKPQQTGTRSTPCTLFIVVTDRPYIGIRSLSVIIMIYIKLFLGNFYEFWSELSRISRKSSRSVSSILYAQYCLYPIYNFLCIKYKQKKAERCFTTWKDSYFVKRNSAVIYQTTCWIGPLVAYTMQYKIVMYLLWEIIIPIPMLYLFRFQ